MKDHSCKFLFGDAQRDWTEGRACKKTGGVMYIAVGYGFCRSWSCSFMDDFLNQMETPIFGTKILLFLSNISRTCVAV